MLIRSLSAYLAALGGRGVGRGATQYGEHAILKAIILMSKKTMATFPPDCGPQVCSTLGNKEVFKRRFTGPYFLTSKSKGSPENLIAACVVPSRSLRTTLRWQPKTQILRKYFQNKCFLLLLPCPTLCLCYLHVGLPALTASTSGTAQSTTDSFLFDYFFICLETSARAGA